MAGGLGWFFWWSDWSDRGIFQSAGRLVAGETSVSNESATYFVFHNILSIARLVIFRHAAPTHGLEYLLAATVLAGLIQIVAGLLRLGYVMRFVSRSVMTGFVNALAILIFIAQLPELIHVPVLTYVMVAAGLGIIYLFPYVTKTIPSPLVCILFLTAVSIFLQMDLRTVGDMGDLPSTLPVFLLPDIPLTFETLSIILPYSAAVAAVGLLESLMTASIVDELTDTNSDKNRECIGQGIANTATGFIGGMAGCAMIGQSIINVKSGGRGRLSTLCAGVFLLLMIVFLGDWVKQIPMAALVAIMIMVSIGTFSWSSIKNLKTHPRSSSTVMLATVAAVLATHNLAIGVLVGVLFSGIFFAWKIAQIFRITSVLNDDGKARTYIVEGQLFFASVDDFRASFDFKEVLERVTIDVSKAHIWDISSVTAIDLVVLKFRREGAEVKLIAFDGGPSVIKAVEAIAGNHIFADLECELLRVGEATPEATGQMDSSASLLRDAGYQVKTKFESGQPETVITREVETDAYELMIMGAFGHSRIRNLIIGSTTTEMIRSCKIPVLLFR